MSHGAEPALHRFRNILFSPLAARGNTAAMRRVCELARRDEASVTAVGVVHEASAFQRLLHGSEHVDAVLAEEHRLQERRLARCVDSVPDGGVTTIVDVGTPALSLIRRAIAAEHDLLVVTSDEDDEDRATIQRIIRKSPCPVWVIRPTRARAIRVLAAVDPEPEQVGLNDLILDIAASLAGDAGELHVVNAWQLYGESTMQSSAFLQIDPVEVERRRELVRVAHEEAVESLVAKRGTEPWVVHVEAGDPRHMIEELIRRLHVNLVVMGTIGRSGISGLVMGNTAERVLADLRCSVVAVKPPGFVSPIRL